MGYEIEFENDYFAWISQLAELIGAERDDAVRYGPGVLRPDYKAYIGKTIENIEKLISMNMVL